MTSNNLHCYIVLITYSIIQIGSNNIIISSCSAALSQMFYTFQSTFWCVHEFKGGKVCVCVCVCVCV